jgi:GntR family transcriptional regulator
MLRLTLDRSAPARLYHQIMQAIRWQIGTGVLVPGQQLPPIRDAAREWGVNYHTVRRAYRELAREGWVESLGESGTRIAAALPAESGATGDDLQQWVDHMLAVAHERYGLSADRLAALVRERGGVLRVVMVECNVHQSTFLAQQLEQAWPVEAIPWSLEAAEEPPRLPIVGTYFHHAEMKSRWPDRIDDMHFVTLHLDPALEARIDRAAARAGARVLWLVEQDAATAHGMAEGVRTLLSDGFEIRPVVGDPDRMLRSLAPDHLLLVAPRLWDRMSQATRNDRRVLDVRHTISRDDLHRVWRSLRSRGATAPTS